MRKYNDALICSRLQEVLDYSPETGEFRWKVATSPSAKVGALAGRVANNGYQQIGIDKRRYLAHRLAWLYTTGKWPDKDIDHINGFRADNRICNLREATRSQNSHNSRKFWGRSRYRGVCWNKYNRKWQAQIGINGRQTYLGLFATEELAAAAYQEAQRKFHPFVRET